MTLADRLRANATLLQMLHQQRRNLPRALLPALVADLLRDAADADRLDEARAFMDFEAKSSPRYPQPSRRAVGPRKAS